jgi:hypothetical protein
MYHLLLLLCPTYERDRLFNGWICGVMLVICLALWRHGCEMLAPVIFEAVATDDLEDIHRK